MKKWVMGTAAVVMSASLIVSGCGSNTDTQANSGANGEKKAVKLRMWGAVPEENGPKAVIDKWNQSHPDIQMEYVRYVNDDSGNTKLDTALMTQSDAPDIFVSYGEANLNRRLNASMTAPLDELIKKENFNVEEIIGMENIQKFKDQIHYLPANKIIDMIVINKKALDEAGVKVPAEWTWDEYVALAQKLTKDGRKGSFITPGSDLFISKFALATVQPKDAFYTADGLSNFNHPAVKKGLELQKALYDQGSMVPWAEGVANKLDPANELLTGKAAMVYGGTYMLRTIKDTAKYPRDFAVAFAPTPQFAKGTNVNNGGVNDFMSINKNSANKEAAFKFMAWYLQEGNMDMVAGGRIPTNKKADFNKITELIIGQDEKIIDKESLTALIKGNLTFATRFNSVAFPQLNTILREESEKFFMNVQDIDKTMEALKSRADKAIQSERK
ncbi:ABC transporter substrate-binding protein [Paenibacillus validus]|uniref:Extracellular solute-binding protein n=1 Tax=Paenibacillus validus TaxID=44253 RepID=A0A7X2ZD84_9BACL|nr:extracellular solute-binding protein [Paenibacillus validus]MUG71986.1 extracellular solute-binding protein [Paenibacillus validus]